MPRAKTARNGDSLSKSANTTSQLSVSLEMPTKTNGNSLDLEAEIRRRAYELYEERGCTPGHESEDWAIAEREISARYSLQNA